MAATGADKILDICINKRIPIQGVFASDGFVRSRSFREMPVQSLTAIQSAYGDDFVVLLAFGTTLPEVWENMQKIGQRHTLLIPEVPLFGGELFDYAYYKEHLPELEKAYSLFDDTSSKDLFEDMIAFRLTGHPIFLANTENVSDCKNSLHIKKYAPCWTAAHIRETVQNCSPDPFIRRKFWLRNRIRKPIKNCADMLKQKLHAPSSRSTQQLAAGTEKQSLNLPEAVPAELARIWEDAPNAE